MGLREPQGDEVKHAWLGQVKRNKNKCCLEGVGTGGGGAVVGAGGKRGKREAAKKVHTVKKTTPKPKSAPEPEPDPKLGPECKSDDLADNHADSEPDTNTLHTYPPRKTRDLTSLPAELDAKYLEIDPGGMLRPTVIKVDPHQQWRKVGRDWGEGRGQGKA